MRVNLYYYLSLFGILEKRVDRKAKDGQLKGQPYYSN